MQVAVFEKRWIPVRKAAKERLEKCSQQNLCVACMQKFEEGETPTRGCHKRCYYATYRGIKAEKFTDSERVAAGKLLPPAERGRKPSNAVSVEVA